METSSPYVPPKLKSFGSIVDLTQTGQTNPGDDGKGGSVGGPGHPPGAGLDEGQ